MFWKRYASLKFAGIGAVLGVIIGAPLFRFIFNDIAEKATQLCALKQGYIGMCDYGRGVETSLRTIIATVVLMVIFAVIGWFYGKIKNKKNN